MDEYIVASKSLEGYTNDENLEGNVIDQNSGNESNDNESNSEDNPNPVIAVRYYLQSIEEEEQNEDEIQNNIINNNDSNTTEVRPNNDNQTNDVDVIRPIVQHLGLLRRIPNPNYNPEDETLNTSTAEGSNQSIERSRNSAFNRVRRIPNSNYNPEDETLFSDIEQLPQAYPVADLITQDTTFSDNDHDNPGSIIESSDSIVENQYRESSESEQEHNNVDENVNDFILKKHLMRLFIYSFSLLCIPFLVLFTIQELPNQTKKILDKNSTETEETGSSGLHNSTISSSSNNTSHSLNNNITATTTQISLSETCLTDPIMIHNLEFEYYEEQGDTSVPRYYHICPNTTMNVFNLEPRLYTYDFGSGDVFPLILFSPNVNILCGKYGDYSDNCTFSGGFFQVSLNESPMYLDFPINTTSENITIQGFRFTGAKGGSNIVGLSRRSSLTLKNCKFDNNHKMTASVSATFILSEQSKLYVDGCTFENNSYHHNTTQYIDGASSRIPNIGAILSFNVNPFAIIETYVLDSTFSDNEFVIDNKEVLMRNNYTVEPTGALINIIPPVGRVDVMNTSFVKNKGYSSGLIVLGENARMNESARETTYSGNYFAENVPNTQLYDLSCVVIYQTFNLLFIDDDMHLSSDLHDDCEIYIDENYRK